MSCWLHSNLQDLLMSVSAVFLLSTLGIGITVQAQDCSRPVAGPNMGLKSTDSLLTAFPDGIKVTFDCDIGYVSAGNPPSITCTAGEWSSLKLICERRNCGSLGEVDHGQVDYQFGNLFGDKAVVTCNSGFRLVGDKEITCGHQGWMSRKPVCEVMTCDPPPMLTNGAFTPVKEHYNFREVIEYRCHDGFVVKGSALVTCTGDETFEPEPPTCTRVECEDPNVKNAKWFSGSRPPYLYKSSVTLKCDSDYRMIGSDLLTCGIDNEWYPSLPRCEKILPPTKPTTTTKTPPTTTSTSTPSDSGDNVSRTVGIVVGALAVCCVVGFGLWYCGLLPFTKRKRGDNTETEAAKDGEDVALS